MTSVMTHTSIPVWATRAGVGDSAAAGAAVGMAVGGMECMLHIEHVRAQSRHMVPSDAGAKDRYFNGGELDLSQVQPADVLARAGRGATSNGTAALSIKWKLLSVMVSPPFQPPNVWKEADA